MSTAITGLAAHTCAACHLIDISSTISTMAGQWPITGLAPHTCAALPVQLTVAACRRMTTLHLDSRRLTHVDLTNCEAVRDLRLPALAPALAALQVGWHRGGSAAAQRRTGGRSAAECGEWGAHRWQEDYVGVLSPT